MVDFVPRLETPEDRDGVLHLRFPHEDRLKAALQGGILLDLLSVLVEGGGPHAPKLPTGEGRLEHVGGVHTPLGRPGTHQGVKLVDEEHHRAPCLLDLLEDRLEAILELPPVLGARHQGADVEGHETSFSDPLRNIAGDDPLGQPLDDGGLADTGLADEDRIVLPAPREDLDHSPYLFVPADHRIETI